MSTNLTHGRGAHKPKQDVAAISFSAGTRLIDREHASQRIYLLRSGQLQLLSGHEAILDHLTRGDLFGEKSFLSSSRTEQIAKALSPVETIVFRKSEFLKRLREDPRFASQVLRNFAQRMDRYEESIHNLLTESAEWRLALALIRLADPRPASGWVRIPSNPSNLELAKIVGTTRWRISHFLSRFQQRGWISRQEGLRIQRDPLQAFLESTTHCQRKVGAS